MVYALLRKSGVEIGKGDFLGADSIKPQMRPGEKRVPSFTA